MGQPHTTILFSDAPSATASGLPPTVDHDARVGVPAVVIPGAPTPGEPRQLSALDVQLLDCETATAALHVGMLILLDSRNAPRGPLTADGLRRLFGDRLHLAPALRWRLRTVPLGIDLPYWEDAETIDLGSHIREVRLPAGAGDVQLAEYVERRHAEPLDRSRPLWECDLLTGLADGRQAVYAKVHHSVVDGMSAAEIMAAILDVSADGAPRPLPADGIPRTRTPSAVEMVARSVPNVLTRQVTRVGAVLQAGSAIVGIGSGVPAKHEQVPFNGPSTANRSVAFVSLPLDAVKAIKAGIDGTVNDVVMALCTSAVRRWMLDHDVDVDTPLLAAIPVSVRTPEQFGTGGNRFSVMLSSLPISEPNPHHRLKLLHDSLIRVKERFAALPPALLEQISSLVPSLMHGVVTRALIRIAAPVLPLANLIVSNIPGPQLPLYIEGIRVLRSYPVSTLVSIAGSLNITVMSYDGHLDFGIVACSDDVPDVWDIAHYLEDALRELQM
ncbi:wax ester/triacylglycerol synthase family O-acyltransferase [Nocardia sp. BSTN01]|uniref:wax ester/triacylglycerol synthase family O-acyltransferase n=1 Tax=Nocardia sp. BSTN01 TaxID=2783665 RepID=UPI00188E182C|nr:wax ester/triacylglycerol synthase family O-acyltransferase [Nocardia sp. BSTN01]MBF4997312.1 wax ester/triacylglycerol synthase family O-acyltransferase [Nocardia sp. BSTN01]